MSDPAGVVVRGADTGPAVADFVDGERRAAQGLRHLLGALVRLGTDRRYVVPAHADVAHAPDGTQVGGGSGAASTMPGSKTGSRFVGVISPARIRSAQWHATSWPGSRRRSSGRSSRQR